MRLVFLCVVVLLMFSGCVDPGPPKGSAMAGVAPASDIAKRWAPDAFLVAVLTTEKDDTSDDRRGDGRAPVWGYLYEAGSVDGSLSVGVDPEGGILFAEPSNVSATNNVLVRPIGGGARLGSWKVDSVEVTAAIADVLPNYGTVANEADMEFTMVLVRMADGAPFWAVELREVERTKRLVLEARMDAVTGEFLSLKAEPHLE